MLANRAFSLVELSIVLVILGLLTGGILSGQSLIHAAELRKTTSDLSRYVTAIHTFRDKYFALPGDMTNAYKFWGVAAGCTNTSVLAAPYDGCNGNGDGTITDSNSNGGEDLRAWQFLAVSGLVEGTYTGLPAASGNLRQGGVNMPRLPLNATGVYWINSITGANVMGTGNNIFVGAEGSINPSGGVMSTEDIWNIDTKLDDGLATSGKITPSAGAAACYSGSEYILTQTSKTACNMFWWMR